MGFVLYIRDFLSGLLSSTEVGEVQCRCEYVGRQLLSISMSFDTKGTWTNPLILSNTAACIYESKLTGELVR